MIDNKWDDLAGELRRSHSVNLFTSLCLLCKVTSARYRTLSGTNSYMNQFVAGGFHCCTIRSDAIMVQKGNLQFGCDAKDRCHAMQCVFYYTTCVAQKFRFKLSKVIVDDYSKSIIKICKKETYGTCIYGISVIKNGFHGNRGTVLAVILCIFQLGLKYRIHNMAYLSFMLNWLTINNNFRLTALVNGANVIFWISTVSLKRVRVSFRIFSNLSHFE